MSHILFLLVVLAVPLATTLATRWFDWPNVAAISTAIVVVVYARHVMRLRRGMGTPGDLGWWIDPYRSLEHSTRGEQEAIPHRIAAFLQLMELSEIWRARAKSPGVQGVLDDVAGYVQRDFGFDSVAILRIGAATDELTGTWVVGVEQGARLSHTRWALRGLGGAVARCLQTASITDCEAGQPLLTVNSERFEPDDPTPGAYRILPILSPLARPECIEEGWLYRPGCPAFEPASPANALPIHPKRQDGLDLQPCLGCRHYPVHGALAVAESSQVDLGATLEQTLTAIANVLAGVFDRAALYRQVGAAERFRAQALDAMTNGLVSTDQHGRIMFANSSANQLFGDVESVNGRRLEDLLEIPSSTSPLHRTLVEGIPALHLEGFLHRAGGGSTRGVPVRLNLAPYRLDEGGRYGAVCVFEDLSSVRAMEEEIRHLDTLAAIGRFASSMAHEIRNPLGGISAGITFLSRSSNLTDTDREGLDVIQGEILRLDGIIKNLLAVARPKELHLILSSLREVVERSMKTLDLWAQERNVRLSWVEEARESRVYMDVDMIQQVVMNLLKNAIEASPDGGEVRLRFREGQSPDGAEEVTLIVEDDGRGIAEEDIPRLFEPFFSRKAEGSGLGLYVCHNFVLRHGGRLNASHAGTGGARFEMTLPTHPARLGARYEAATTHR